MRRFVIDALVDNQQLNGGVVNAEDTTDWRDNAAASFTGTDDNGDEWTFRLRLHVLVILPL
jgi:hypothetical protein